ncbi:hypothetical protein [Colwellia sp. BRX8-9]|uniref:hypothetical protein n=1 Tax=Colwellia sp. BRX8-9 TaxID=2759831 RepID=UPI0015F5885D|nr:hypothetical protein [Colwellia sp. BRX8-9]MBA6348106.1 hypothetical protein [Colwellia sp. BRX8-9]
MEFKKVALLILVLLLSNVTLSAFANKPPEHYSLIDDYKALFRSEKIGTKYVAKVESTLPPKLQSDMYSMLSLTKGSFTHKDWKEKQRFAIRLFHIFQAIVDRLSHLEETKLKKLFEGYGRDTTQEFKNALTEYIKKHDAIMDVAIAELDKAIAELDKTIAEQDKTIKSANTILKMLGSNEVKKQK